MNTMMNRSSFSYESTAEDRLVVRQWTLRLAIFYSAMLLALVLVWFVSTTHDNTDIAKAPRQQPFSAASVTSDHPAR